MKPEDRKRLEAMAFWPAYCADRGHRSVHWRTEDAAWLVTLAEDLDEELERIRGIIPLIEKYKVKAPTHGR